MKKRISPTTVIACLALFFSLGGAGLAASTTAPRLGYSSDQPPVMVSPGHTADVVASCSPGSRPTGGGWRDIKGTPTILGSYPSRGTWTVHVSNPTQQVITVSAVAACLG